MAVKDGDIDWFPLPEVSTASNEKTTPMQYSTPSTTTTPNNLTIFTIDNTPMTSSHLTTPTQLDELWNQFLSMNIGKPRPPVTTCSCYCHHTNKQQRGEFNKSIETQSSSTKTTPLHNDDKPHPHITNSAHSKGSLSLQEACKVYKKDFIRNSLTRQQLIKQRIRKELDMTTPIRTTTRTHDPIHQNSKMPQFISFTGKRPKMSHKEMYYQSKKYWNKLPEVIAKVDCEKKQKMAATNRLRVKIYQREVLARMRRIHNY